MRTWPFHRWGRLSLALAALALLSGLTAAPAHAFLPGALSAPDHERLRQAGAGGVAPERALQLRLTDPDRTTPWNLLVLLVDFPDRAGDRNSGGPAAWQRTIFGSDPALPSLAGYYRENSAGRLQIQGLVTPWVRLSEPAAYYLSDGPGNLGGGIDPAAYPHNSQRLVEEVVQRLGSAYRWSDFDNNGDGLIDGLLVVAAGAGAEETAPLSDPANRLLLLAHQFHTTFEVPAPPVRVFDYAIVAADAPLGVVAHEVGHLFGLIDLYQTGSFVSSSGPFGVGDWSLMGTGALIDGGRMPAHLDAWSKARLGFVDPVTITIGTTGLRLNPAAHGGRVLRLGRGTTPEEYFLAEARFRVGFDAGLPGEGLVVYHVLETSQTNSNPARYKVAVVQADGRNDLGRSGGNRGDPGDPWPQASPANSALTESSTPSSRDYAGNDSGVRLTNIQHDGSAIQLDARLDLPPDPRLVALAIREISGNGDGVIDPGERGTIDVTVENLGADIPTEEHTLALAATDPRVVMEQSLAVLGELAAGERRFVPDLFRFRLDPEAPAEELPVVFHRIFAFRSCAGCPPVIALDSLTLALGPFVPFRDDVEGGDGGWTHESGFPAGRDQWQRATTTAHSGAAAWFCGSGAGGSYARGMDAQLTQRGVRVPARGRLEFWQRVAAESLSTDRAWDGGRVEARFPGSDWRPLEPVGGYPFTLESGSGNRLFDARAFSGWRDWHRRVVDLAPFAGARIDLRFRFATDLFEGPDLPGPDGWWIDDVAVVSGTGSPRPRATLATGGGVLVRWSVPEPAPDISHWRLSRRRPDPDALPLPVARVPATPQEELSVREDPPSGPWVYRLEGESDGTIVVSAESAEPLLVPLPGRLPVIAGIYPRPFRPTGPGLNCEISIPTGSPANSGWLDLFDVQGRRVTSLPWTAGEGTVYRLQWDGRTERGPIRSGLYWARLRWSTSGGSEETGMSERLVVVP